MILQSPIKKKQFFSNWVNNDQIKYPWDSSAARKKGFNKACRYSKLNLWNLTQYKKVSHDLIRM
jgi:hypothetical protein